MDKLWNLLTTKKTLDKFFLLPIGLDWSIHVIISNNLAIVQLLSNSLSKVDIELRNNLYN